MDERRRRTVGRPVSTLLPAAGSQWQRFTGNDPLSSRLLHLGCGTVAPPEWVNVDGSGSAWLARHPVLRSVAKKLRRGRDVAWPTNILVHDLRKPLPFADASFDGAYSSHLIEHMHRTEAVRLLKDTFRVLKPGAPCRTLVPDLEAGIERYLADRGKPEIDAARELNTLLGMRGESPVGGNALYRYYFLSKDLHSHKFMYDATALIRLMEEAGFVNNRRMGFRESSIPHIDGVEQKIRHDGGVAIEGIKPA